MNAFLTDSLAVVYVWHFTATTVCCSRVLDVHTLLSAQDIDAGRSRADRSSERQATVRGAGRAGAKVSWPHVVEQRCDSGARGGCEWAVARGVPVGGAGCAPRSRPDARLRWPENLLQTVCLCRRSISVLLCSVWLFCCIGESIVAGLPRLAQDSNRASVLFGLFRWLVREGILDDGPTVRGRQAACAAALRCAAALTVLVVHPLHIKRICGG